MRVWRVVEGPDGFQGGFGGEGEGDGEGEGEGTGEGTEGFGGDFGAGGAGDGGFGGAFGGFSGNSDPFDMLPGSQDPTWVSASSDQTLGSPANTLGDSASGFGSTNPTSNADPVEVVTVYGDDDTDVTEAKSGVSSNSYSATNDGFNFMDEAVKLTTGDDSGRGAENHLGQDALWAALPFVYALPEVAAAAMFYEGAELAATAVASYANWKAATEATRALDEFVQTPEETNVRADAAEKIINHYIGDFTPLVPSLWPVNPDFSSPNQFRFK